MLKIVKTNSAFIDHRNKNLLLHKEKFILKICFKSGKYDEDMVIYDKYKGLPYVWFIKSACDNDSSGTEDRAFKVVDSVIQLNYHLNLRKKSCVYIKCNLFPLKEIIKNNTIKFISSTPPTDMNIAVDAVTKVKVKAASNTEEIKPKKLYEHPNPIISKTGQPWAKDAARFNNNKPKVKVTK